MRSDCQAGLYGKLPGYGDFLTRNLASNFVESWDNWLQLYISATREQIGDSWLDTYLTSPIWRFVLSSGVIDGQNWGGVIMPSVDRVGRYFPVTLIKPFPVHVSPVNYMLNQTHWYDEVESLCLTALEENMDVDELVEVCDQIELNINDAYYATTQIGEMGAFVIGLPGGEDNGLDFSMAFAFNALLAGSLSSFSIWQTQGSSLVAPSLFCCQGLPLIGGIASMMDGQWQSRNWKIPFNLNT
ncbi:MAG: type VI secretion system-associated protein TagF [Gammaproteobacteria bacterium]|nr:type VI secretion system-associated protein TagF [Gammaproteobacteria bacterium]